jgi:DNA-binding transcriptional ArsR family regulator
MSQSDDAQWVQRILGEASDGFVDLLKAAAHPARVQVLVRLLDGGQDFGQLMTATQLSKTALANHLTQLLNQGLVERLSRGSYQLTADGRTLLVAAARFFEGSAARESARRAQVQRAYTGATREAEAMSRKVVSQPAVYVDCWISYTGAMAGALRALGMSCDLVDVGGHSGYAFIANVAKGQTCPSGPTAMERTVWEEIAKGTESLGWRLDHYTDEEVSPAQPGKPTPAEYARLQRLFDRVKREIDERDRPVVLWGPPIPEYGIVNGYEGTTYLVSTYRRITGQADSPVPFAELQAPGCLDAYFFREPVKVNKAAVDRAALDRAVRFASAAVPVHNQYVGGPAAFEEWARVLEAVPEKQQNYMGNSYVGACLWEAREVAAKFLMRLAKGRSQTVAQPLLAAAKAYGDGANHLKAFKDLFPFKFEGPMLEATRRQGAALLRQVKPLEDAAIQQMRKALAAWRA